MTNNIVEAFNKTRKAGAIASAALDEVVKISKNNKVSNTQKENCN